MPVRSLRATATFTGVALAVLALDIGATTAIFSVVDGTALQGLPYLQRDRLVKLTEPATSRRVFQGASVLAADIADWRAAGVDPIGTLKAQYNERRSVL